MNRNGAPTVVGDSHPATPLALAGVCLLDHSRMQVSVTFKVDAVPEIYLDRYALTASNLGDDERQDIADDAEDGQEQRPLGCAPRRPREMRRHGHGAATCSSEFAAPEQSSG